MKLIIDINEIAYKNATHIPSIDWNGNLLRIVNDALQHGTPISDNATNGDVIKAMFHCLEKYEYEEPYTHGIVLVGNDNRVTWFVNDWWNSPYQKGGKE